ncbi:MAG: PAS domain S-box protein [Chloroflexaceae bacterium]|nr:PAS domain S-box protein [Chloroflexaceae bacterium]
MENTDVHQKKAQILIVDDQAANLRILSAMLMKQGYEVRAVTSGSSALKSIELDPPDIILLDICMPGMDGYEVCQTLKDRESTQDIPIIFITALDEMVDKVRAFRLGAADYITKPFQMEEVLIRVENQLSIKRTREALQQSEARYRAIIEDQTELICRFQLDYTLTFVNQTFCRAFGRVPEDVIGQPVVDFFPDQQSVQQCAMQLHKLTTDDPFCINEHRIVNDQGDSRWIEWTTRAIFDMQGNISEFQAVGRDVTEQLQSEAERRKLQRAVEQSPTSIVITDIDGVIEYVNPKFTQLTGYTFAEARGSNPNILKAGDTAITAYQELWETIKSGRAWHGEFHNRRKTASSSGNLPRSRLSLIMTVRSPILSPLKKILPSAKLWKRNLNEHASKPKLQPAPNPSFSPI